ncbi:hypothetical protein P0Y35_18895 [Kiritimatiellaeota bacterium B1221]|nr:hypothetical protein [Kiritimatiellaeota bacterium B1221]
MDRSGSEPVLEDMISSLPVESNPGGKPSHKSEIAASSIFNQIDTKNVSADIDTLIADIDEELVFRCQNGDSSINVVTANSSMAIKSNGRGFAYSILDMSNVEFVVHNDVFTIWSAEEL